MSIEYQWFRTNEILPPDGVIVKTMISDIHGERNIQTLKRMRNLWFYPDGSMYVYYTPTKWRYCTLDEVANQDTSGT